MGKDFFRHPIMYTIIGGGILAILIFIVNIIRINISYPSNLIGELRVGESIQFENLLNPLEQTLKNELSSGYDNKNNLNYIISSKFNEYEGWFGRFSNIYYLTIRNSSKVNSKNILLKLSKGGKFSYLWVSEGTSYIGMDEYKLKIGTIAPSEELNMIIWGRLGYNESIIISDDNGKARIKEYDFAPHWLVVFYSYYWKIVSILGSLGFLLFIADFLDKKQKQKSFDNKKNN